jgi:anti-sigma regulatory factor (Ser/Thr protein kinase)
VAYWVKTLEDMVSQNAFDGARCPDFLKPFHLVTLALAIKKHAIGAVNLSEEIQSYATRMHLWEGAGLDAPYAIQEHDCSTSLIPVQAIRDVEDIDEVSKAFEVIADNHYEDGESNDFGTVISELLDNCYRHAERSEELFGLACVQAWQGGNKGQLCIADTGIGIRNALSSNADYSGRLVRENACEMAVEYGVSGKLGEDHSGYGLALTKGVIELNQGNMLLISGNECFQSEAGVSEAFTLESQWNGTLIILEWNLDQPLDSKPVYESWPLEDENNEFDDLF